jgi:hypothetical protein
MQTEGVIIMETKHAMIAGTLAAATRMRSSRNGNPRYSLTILAADGSLIALPTAPDSATAYAVPNHRIGAAITITTNGRGHVIAMSAA